MGYDGPITAEPFSAEVREMENEEAARATLESLNKIWQVAGVG